MRVHGVVTVPGDKSITQRGLVLGALAHGHTCLEGALTSLDSRSLAGALRSLGVSISPLRSGGTVSVLGMGLRGLREPGRTINCGNSGTAARFILGILSACPFSARVTGDASLRRRPMRRVTVPLEMMGARFKEERGDGLPLVVTGGTLRPLKYALPVASAQVKSALLFAGLASGVKVAVTEPTRSRDHTERLLDALGAGVTVSDRSVSLNPPREISPFEMQVPGDISSAAFLAGATLLADSGELRIKRVGLNPVRLGFLRVLDRMGARVRIFSAGQCLGEPVGDLEVRAGPLQATEITPDEVPSLIDEVPILAVLASRAEGETVFQGVAELAAKESDRLSLLAHNLRALGVEAETTRDTLTVVGTDRPPRGMVETMGDHRVAMSFAVLRRVRGARVELSESASPDISYPGFFSDLDSIYSND